MNIFWQEAINTADLLLVRDLLLRGADIDARDRFGQTGLMLAAHAGQRELVALLIAEGAELNVTAKYGLSALMLAVVAGHGEVALLLARAGADLTLKGTGAPGFAGKTAFDLAVERKMFGVAAAVRPGYGS